MPRAPGLPRLIGPALLVLAALSLCLALLVGSEPLRLLLAIKGLAVMTAAMATLGQTQPAAPARVTARRKR